MAYIFLQLFISASLIILQSTASCVFCPYHLNLSTRLHYVNAGALQVVVNHRCLYEMRTLQQPLMRLKPAYPVHVGFDLLGFNYVKH